MTPTTHPLVTAYLDELDRLLAGIDPGDRAEVVSGVRDRNSGGSVIRVGVGVDPDAAPPVGGRPEPADPRPTPHQRPASIAPGSVG